MANYTQDQLNKLQEAIAQGVLKVEYSDKKVTYRSLDEMLKLQELMKKDLGLDKTGGNRRFAKFNKGLDGSN